MPSLYTPDQLEAYLHRIGYASPTPQSTRLQHLQQSIKDDALSALAELQRRHISSIPWGNSAIHYSQHHSISTHPSAVYEKLVVRRLDGYCMENTNLLYGVLRSLGFQVYPTAGRVSNAAGDPKNPPAEIRYASLAHMVNIVTIDGQKYMVDVGFGNNVPTSPLPLEENIITPNIAPTEMCLAKEPLPEAADQTQKFWVYQIRFNPESKWVPLYAFFDCEFLPQDFATFNYQTSTMPSSWFTQMVVCVKHFLNGKGDKIEGLYIMGGKVVKKRTLGETETVETLANEEDRVKALSKWFGMDLLEHEAEGIRGMGSELK